jgi:hypothetical protein
MEDHSGLFIPDHNAAVVRQRSVVAYAFHYQQSNAVLAHVAKGHGCRCLHRIALLVNPTLTWRIGC